MIHAEIDSNAWVEGAQTLSDYLLESGYLARIWVQPDRCTYVTQVLTLRVCGNDDAPSYEELVSSVMRDSGYSLPASWIPMVPDSVLCDEEGPTGMHPTIHFDQLTVIVASEDPYVGC